MAGEPINAWDMRVLAGSEASLGTVPALAAAQYLECINLSLGPAAELGRTRPKQDRNLGRGWTKDFVTGRVEAIAFDMMMSVKSRSAVDADSKELALMKAGGLLQTVSAGVSETYTMPADPIGAASFASVSLLRGFGPDLYRYEAEQLRGGVVRAIEYSGGDKELMAKFSGVGIGKYALGYVASITLADGSGTTLTLSETDSRKIGPGFYKVESEVIQVTGTNANQGDTSRSILRAQLGTTGAAHAAKPMVPHMPSGLSATGSPISEANCTVTIDSIAHRALSFSLHIDTGMDLLPGETGSAYVQGVKCTRSKVTGSVKMNLLKEYTADIGKAVNRKSVPISIVCGTGTGGIVTFTLAQSELRPFVVPDTANDVAVVEVPFESFDSSSGNDQLSIVKT
jgi:hypothetical protein